MWQTTVRYMKGSSIAGLCHAANARSYIRGTYWLVIFVVGLVLTARSLVVLVDEFLQHPVVTSSELITREKVAFPAITMCNINRVNCLNLMSESYELQVLVEAGNFTSEAEAEETGALALELADLSVKTGCVAQVNWRERSSRCIVRVQSNSDNSGQVGSLPFSQMTFLYHKFCF